MRYRQLNSIGGKGGGEGRFQKSLPAIVVSGDGSLYVGGDSKICVFDSAGNFVREWTTAKPVLSVAVAADGSVYVGEYGQVEVFDTRGKLVRAWDDPERLGPVTAIGFVADSVIVGDSRARCIRRYSPEGKFLHNIGKDNRMKGFLIPNGIVDFSVDGEGVIHATNPGKHRVERYTVDDELLGHIGRFDGLNPEGFSGCCNPTNVTVSGGRTYVTEKAEPRAKVYDSDGGLVAIIAADVFNLACKNMDIAVAGDGRVFVVDTVKLEVLVFSPEEVPS